MVGLFSLRWHLRRCWHWGQQVTLRDYLFFPCRLSLAFLGQRPAARFPYCSLAPRSVTVVRRCLDRYSVNLILSLGRFVFAAAFAIIAMSSSIPLMIALLFGPAALGFAATGTLTTGTLISRWFFKRRGLALGIGAVATSGGGIFIAPWLAYFMQTHGWRTTLLVEAALILSIVISLAILVVRNHPADMRLGGHRENDNRPQSELAPNSENSKIRWREILLNRTFWGQLLFFPWYQEYAKRS